MTITNGKEENAPVPMKDSEASMGASEATQFVKSLTKLLQSKNIWCTVTEKNEPDLKFIKIEASVKVKK